MLLHIKVDKLFKLYVITYKKLLNGKMDAGCAR